jgi:hypothetical protein
LADCLPQHHQQPPIRSHPPEPLMADTAMGSSPVPQNSAACRSALAVFSHLFTASTTAGQGGEGRERGMPGVSEWLLGLVWEQALCAEKAWLPWPRSACRQYSVEHAPGLLGCVRRSQDWISSSAEVPPVCRAGQGGAGQRGAGRHSQMCGQGKDAQGREGQAQSDVGNQRATA